MFKIFRRKGSQIRTWFLGLVLSLNVFPRYEDLAKRLQQFSAIYPSNVGCNMPFMFDHSVARCWDKLGGVGSKLSIFQLEPTTPNMLQHVTIEVLQRWQELRSIVAIFWPLVEARTEQDCCCFIYFIIIFFFFWGGGGVGGSQGI